MSSLSTSEDHSSIRIYFLVNTRCLTVYPIVASDGVALWSKDGALSVSLVVSECAFVARTVRCYLSNSSLWYTVDEYALYVLSGFCNEATPTMRKSSFDCTLISVSSMVVSDDLDRESTELSRLWEVSRVSSFQSIVDSLDIWSHRIQSVGS